MELPAGQVALAAGETKDVALTVTSPGTATSGVKTLALRVVGAHNGHVLYKKTLEYVVNQAAAAPPPPPPPPTSNPCVNAPPTFKVDPIRRNGGAPGQTVWYGLYMTSHDTGRSCGGRLLNITMDLPGSKWKYTPGQATLAVGEANKKVGIQVTASPTANKGVKSLVLRVVGAYNGKTLFTQKLEYVVN